MPFRGQSVDPERTADVVAIVGMSTSEDPRVRSSLAKNPSTPGWLRTKLATDPSYVVRNAIMQYGQARGHDLDVGTMRLLAKDEYFIVRAAVPSLMGCPQDLIADLAGDVHAFVRSRVAAHTNDPSILATMALDSAVGVRDAVASSPFTPIGTLLAMTGDTNKQVRIRLAQVNHESVLTALVSDRSFEVRQTLAQNPYLPASAQASLAGDPYVEVVLALVENPTFCTGRTASVTDTIEGLLARIGPKSYRVVERVVAIDSLPLERRAEIASRSRSPRVRSCFFESLSPDQVTELSQSHDVKVRSYASKYLVRSAMR